MLFTLKYILKMPSCVVKHCENSSLSQNKHIGVTFHKFPGEFDLKNKWIQVIRSNRKDDSWLPSKHSVVCSVHFEDGDLYITESGLQRVLNNAVPKKVLADQIGDDDCIVCDSSTSSGSQTPISHKADQEYITIIDENAESIGNDASSPMTDVENDPCNPLEVVRIIPSVYSPKVEYVIESDTESTLDNSFESKLRKQLKRETEIVNRKMKKIKNLRRKIRRLDMNYEILNKKLKELKDKNAIDQEGTRTIEIE